jgi:glutamate/tyrosine decarboxylase-like PLP-dependent enzyme
VFHSVRRILENPILDDTGKKWKIDVTLLRHHSSLSTENFTDSEWIFTEQHNECNMESSISTPVAFVVIGVGLLIVLPPLPVVVRQIRPLVSFLGIVGWIAFRLSPSDHSTSLLQYLHRVLAYFNERLVKLLTSNEADTNYLLVGAARWLWTVAEDFMAILLLSSLARVIYCLRHYSIAEWKYSFTQSAFDWALDHVAVFAAQLEKQAKKVKTDSEPALGKDPNRVKITAMPVSGRAAEDIVQELQHFAEKEDKMWQLGKVSGTVYSNSDEHTSLMNRVYAAYSWSNPLHPGIWPKLNQCEGEVIAMTADMLHAPPIGSMTSGGTESIILAIRAHWNVYGKRRGIRHPELVCGTTAHAAVYKACDMFGIRVVSIDCNHRHDSFQLNPDRVSKGITSNTIMIYASAPSYPQGVVDPIEALSKIALRYKVGLHVDACLGGFVLPFVDDAPVFDFRNPGVTSMSADTHKYGYASKGTSIVLYRDNTLRHGQYFSYSWWTGGLYSTPTIAGSRPGALSACAWAALVSLGKDGYRERSHLIVNAARAIADGIQLVRGVKLLTPKPFMVVSFTSNEMDIYRIQDYMTKAGWNLNALQSPASVHICVTLNVVPKVDSFLRDLKMSINQVRNEGKGGRKKGTAGVYGTVGSLPAGPVDYSLRAFTDLTLEP